MSNSDKLMRTKLREVAGCKGWGAPPIEIVYGVKEPTLEGEGYWFRWLGKYKSYPGSYQPSTRRVEVGQRWLEAFEQCGCDYDKTVAAVKQLRAKARGRLRREIAGFAPPEPEPKTPLQKFRREIEAFRAAGARVFLDGGEALIYSKNRVSVLRLKGGQRLQSAALSALQRVCRLASPHLFREAERSLDRSRHLLSKSRQQFAEELLEKQEQARSIVARNCIKNVASAGTESGYSDWVKMADAYVALPAEREALKHAKKQGQFNVAANQIQQVA